MTNPHTHAEILRWIADGKQVQYDTRCCNLSPHRWKDITPDDAIDLIFNEEWLVEGFRQAPEPTTFILAGIEVPMPLKEAPENGATVWFANAHGASTPLRWGNNEYTHSVLAAGFLHSSHNAAEIHSRALRKANLDAIGGAT